MSKKDNGDIPKTRKEKKGRTGRGDNRSPVYSAKHVRAMEQRQWQSSTTITEHTQTTAP